MPLFVNSFDRDSVGEDRFTSPVLDHTDLQTALITNRLPFASPKDASMRKKQLAETDQRHRPSGLLGSVRVLTAKAVKAVLAPAPVW